jgi:hypothetical protein
MSYVNELNECKHFAVALKDDFSVDLYYDFRLVNTLRSDEQSVYYAIDISFKELFLYALDLQTKKIHKIDINLIWLQKIGLTSGTTHSKKSFEDLREEYHELVEGLTNKSLMLS